MQGKGKNVFLFLDNDERPEASASTVEPQGEWDGFQ